MNMDLDACPLPCCSSPGTPQRHVIHAQFQALWNPNSFTKGRSRPQSRAIMSSFDLSQGPKVSGSLYHLQLQDLNSTATNVCGSGKHFIPAKSWRLSSKRQWASHPTGRGFSHLGDGPQAQLSFQETHTHPGARRQWPPPRPRSPCVLKETHN